VSTLKIANLAVKFLLELAAIAAFAYWGATRDGVVAGVLAGITAPALAVALWGTFAAPNATRRLPMRARVPFELGVFAVATGALIAVGWTIVAIVFAVVVLLNAALLTLWDQWEA
jgi:hypothetical protein